jgi:hypothetical protein
MVASENKRKGINNWVRMTWKEQEEHITCYYKTLKLCRKYDNYVHDETLFQFLLQSLKNIYDIF